MVVRNIKPVIGYVRLDRLTARQLDGLCTLLERDLSTSSVRRHQQLLHAALEQALRWEYIANNPADRASTPDAFDDLDATRQTSH